MKLLVNFCEKKMFIISNSITKNLKLQYAPILLVH